MLGERGRRRGGIELQPGLARVIAVGQAECDDRGDLGPVDRVGAARHRFARRFGPRGRVPRDVLHVRQRRALVDLDRDATLDAALVGRVPRGPGCSPRVHLEVRGADVALRDHQIAIVGVAICVANRRRRLGPCTRMHEASRSGDGGGDQIVLVRRGGGTALELGRAVEPQRGEAEGERVSQGDRVDLERPIAGPRRPDPVQRGHTALAPQVHGECATLDVDHVLAERDLAGGFGVVDDLSRVRGGREPRGEIVVLLTTTLPRHVPRDAIHGTDGCRSGQPTVERADQCFAVIDDRDIEGREPFRRDARWRGIRIEPRAPHRGARRSGPRDEHRLPDPQCAALALVEHDREPDLEPRALAFPHRAVEILAHALTA